MNQYPHRYNRRESLPQEPHCVGKNVFLFPVLTDGKVYDNSMGKQAGNMYRVLFMPQPQTYCGMIYHVAGNSFGVCAEA